ncbi:MAG: hypothetical protein IT221_05280 [Fluviicola sp.]|nr:hypothetical protein [Fluviicola sp.]
MTKIVYSLIILFPFFAFCQTNSGYDKNYRWDNIPVYDETTITTSENAIYLKDVDIIDHPSPSLMDWFRIKHFKIKILTQNGIEENNKIYLPINNSREQKATDSLIIKARIINPNGTVINISKDSILIGEHNGEKYHYFACEGLQIASIIEVFALYEESIFRSNVIPYYFDFNNNYTTLEKVVSLIYHREVSIVTDFTRTKYEHEIIQHFNEYEIHDANNMLFKLKNVERILKEPLTSPIDELDRMYFYFTKNNINNRNERQFEIFALDLNHERQVNQRVELLRDELISTSEFKSNTSEFASLRIYEMAQKSNDKTQFSNQKRISTIRGIKNYFMNMYAAASNLHLKPIIIYAGNREYNKLPYGIYSSDVFYEPLLYFPGIKKYYSLRDDHRIGLPPLEYINTNAVQYIAKANSFNFNQAYFKGFKIEAPYYKESIDSTSIIIQFDLNNSKTNATFFSKQTGYFTTNSQGGVSLLDKVQQYENLSKKLSYHLKDFTIENKEFINAKTDVYNYLPLYSKCTATSESFLTENGTIYIAPIGNLTGEQTQLPILDPSKRVNPVSINFPKKYIKTIIINIPDGYLVDNLSQFNRNVGVDTICKFESRAVLTEQTLTISIEEWYTKCHFPKEAFSPIYKTYKEAVDFYNLNLVLIKDE